MGYYSSWYYGGSGSPASAGSAPGYVSILIPKFTYYPATITIASGAYDQIVFTEGGGNLTATITPGTYTFGGLAQYVKLALEAAGAGDYTVTYSASTRMFTLTKSAGTFTLDHSAGARDLLPRLGFTGDKSGALTYTSDAAVPALTTITCTQKARFPDPTDEVERDDFEASSGRPESSLIKASEKIAFTLEYESTDTHRALKDMWRQAGRYGAAATINYYPDSTLGEYIAVWWAQTRFPMAEMVREGGIYRHYRGEFLFRVLVPAAGTLVARDFDDRRPSS